MITFRPNVTKLKCEIAASKNKEISEAYTLWWRKEKFNF